MSKPSQIVCKLLNLKTLFYHRAHMGKEKPTRIDFDPESRKKFLLDTMHAKAIRKKKAEKRAAQALREERKERRHIKKEKNQEFARDLIDKHEKLGIKPMDILKETAGFAINFVEVDTEQNKTTNAVVDVKDIEVSK